MLFNKNTTHPLHGWPADGAERWTAVGVYGTAVALVASAAAGVGPTRPVHMLVSIVLWGVWTFLLWMFCLLRRRWYQGIAERHAEERH